MGHSEAIQAFTDAWNTGDVDAVVSRYAPGGARLQMAREGTLYEGEGLREHIGAILHAMPEPTLEIRRIAEGGNTVCMEWTYTAVVENDFGPIPGSGQELVLKGHSVVQLDGDGLIVHEALYCDYVMCRAHPAGRAEDSTASPGSSAIRDSATLVAGAGVPG